jgi:hypothetical protein
MKDIGQLKQLKARQSWVTMLPPHYAKGDVEYNINLYVEKDSSLKKKIDIKTKIS